jgi:hypothetical protein
VRLSIIGASEPAHAHMRSSHAVLLPSRPCAEMVRHENRITSTHLHCHEGPAEVRSHVSSVACCISCWLLDPAAYGIEHGQVRSQVWGTVGVKFWGGGEQTLLRSVAKVHESPSALGGEAQYVAGLQGAVHPTTVMQCLHLLRYQRECLHACHNAASSHSIVFRGATCA